MHPILLLESCNNYNRHTGFQSQVNRVNGQGRRAAEEPWTVFGVRHRTIHASQDNSTPLKVFYGLSQRAHRRWNQIHPCSSPHLIFHPPSTLRIRKRQNHWFKSLLANGLKDEIKVAEVETHSDQSVVAKFGPFDHLPCQRV